MTDEPNYNSNKLGSPGPLSQMASALNTQVGGTHYKEYAIQPVEFLHKNGIGFLEGNVIKYVCRYHKKGGKEDLLKAQHYLQILLELEYPSSVIK